MFKNWPTDGAAETVCSTATQPWHRFRIRKELVSVMAAALYREKPSHGKYPCAAENLHRET